MLLKLRLPSAKGSADSLLNGSVGVDMWAPGDRITLQQPVFIPRGAHPIAAAAAKPAAPTATTTTSRKAAVARDGSILYTDEQLHAVVKAPPAAAGAAGGDVSASGGEDAGWVVVMAHNAEKHQVGCSWQPGTLVRRDHWTWR